MSNNDAPTTIEELVSRIESMFPVGPSTIQAFSVTGEPYISIEIVQDECGVVAKETIQTFWKKFMGYVYSRLDTPITNLRLFWRLKPVLKITDSGHYVVRARLLLSSKPDDYLLINETATLVEASTPWNKKSLTERIDASIRHWEQQIDKSLLLEKNRRQANPTDVCRNEMIQSFVGNLQAIIVNEPHQLPSKRPQTTQEMQEAEEG